MIRRESNQHSGKAPSRVLLLAPIGLAVVIFGAWYAVWSKGVETIRTYADEFLAESSSHSINAEYGAYHARGFPFLMRGVFEDLNLSNDEFSYSTDAVIVDALPYDLNRIIFSAQKEQHLNVRGMDFILRAPDSRLSVERHDQRGWMVKTSNGEVPIEFTNSQSSVTAARLLINVAPAEDSADPELADKIDISLTASELAAILSDRSGTLDTLGASVTLTHDPAGLNQRIDGRPDWQSLNAAAEIHGIELATGGSRLAMNGVLRIDRTGRLAGRLSTELTNPSDLLDFLEDIGAVKPRLRSTLDGAMTLAAIAGGGVIRTKVEFKDGDARIFGIRVAAAPRI